MRYKIFYFVNRASFLERALIKSFNFRRNEQRVDPYRQVLAAEGRGNLRLSGENKFDRFV